MLSDPPGGHPHMVRDCTPREFRIFPFRAGGTGMPGPAVPGVTSCLVALT